jgi:hypothetical protein
MKYAALRMFALAVAVCLAWGSLARADYIAQFNFTPDKTDLFATNNPSLGKITLSNESPSKAEGSTTLVATNISTWADASTSLKNPAVFKDVGYTLTLFITDFKSGKSDQMYFSGKFNGTLSVGSALITHDFTTPDTVTKQIGNTIYTVKVGPFVPPGNPTSNKQGSIGALATVTVSAVPEPSTFVLAGLGLVVVGSGCWYRRRRPLAVNLA